MDTSINATLIKVIKEKTLQDNSINVLTDILNISNEAAYRRLRGDVPFTLSEAIQICKELNISLDLLAGVREPDIFAFHLDTFVLNNPMQEYCTMLDRIQRSVVPLKNDPSTRIYSVHKNIPQEFAFNYERLAKVLLYIFYYQSFSEDPEVKTMANFTYHPHTFRLQKESVSNIHDFESMIILDKDIILDFIHIIKFYKDLKMITREEIEGIKKELLLMIGDIEKCANTGKSLSGKKMEIYLSNISFTTKDYTCFESNHFKVSSLGVYCLDFLSCENETVFDIHKKWIMSLRKYSMLISVADELNRRSFFNRQRELVNTLL